MTPVFRHELGHDMRRVACWSGRFESREDFVIPQAPPGFKTKVVDVRFGPGERVAGVMHVRCEEVAGPKGTP